MAVVERNQRHYPCNKALLRSSLWGKPLDQKEKNRHDTADESIRTRRHAWSKKSHSHHPVSHVRQRTRKNVT